MADRYGQRIEIKRFFVFTGTEWLSDDEQTWTQNFNDAASFTTITAAQRIAERQRNERVIYIMQVIG